MEPIHAEFLRLATELEAVKGQVQTECNALRDLFARATAALSSSGSQHDRRLNHREAGRHLPLQFGGSRLDYGDFAFRMEGHAAVLSRDGQGGALLREVAKLEKFEDNTIETLWRTFWDVQQLSAAMAGNLQRKTIRKCVRQYKRGILVAVGHCEEFDPVLVHRAKMEEKDFIDKMGVYDVVPRSDAAEKGCRVIRTRWVTVNKGSDDAPQFRASCDLTRGSAGRE